MRIVFVRHGHPDYTTDTLTELGHRHAAAAAQRLQDEGITEIYASPMGRAQQTAQYTADMLNLPIHTLPFMREVRFRPLDENDTIEHNGNPWMILLDQVSAGESIFVENWQEKEPFRRSKLVGSVETIVAGADAWLRELGYTRECAYYRCGAGTNKTVALFSHGGSSVAVMSRMFNIPFIHACSAFPQNFTGITVVTLPDKDGELVTPRFEILNDARHIKGMTEIISTPAE